MTTQDVIRTSLELVSSKKNSLILRCGTFAVLNPVEGSFLLKSQCKINHVS